MTSKDWTYELIELEDAQARMQDAVRTEPLENPFGLPWFKYLVEADGKRGYVKFGPTGTVQKHI